MLINIHSFLHITTLQPTVTHWKLLLYATLSLLVELLVATTSNCTFTFRQIAHRICVSIWNISLYTRLYIDR